MRTQTLALCLLLATSLFACKKSEIATDLAAMEVSTDTVYTSPQARNLNLVYFVPNDLDTLPAYQKRLSELMLWTQNYMKQEMLRNGYPNKTFGMFADLSINRVKIITIRGTKPKSDYAYSGGAGNVQSEINAYFAARPTEKTSEHTLVILPRYSFRPDGTPDGGPFYGLGRWCFALDYEGLDIKNLGKTDTEGNRFSVWFGGLVHELGHGLNLPHNCQKVSENATLGMALMWAGNGTLGKSSTFLTATDCAILNVNQIFNNDSKTYYGAVNARVTRIHADYSATKSAIVLSGRFTSDTKVNSIVYYNDPNVNNEGVGVNKDYNAVTWESKAIGTDSFYVEMPIADFKYKDASPYELRLKLVHDNGTVTENSYAYKFVNALPVLEFSTKNEISKTGWSIAAFSSQQSAAAAANVIDNNLSTGWHSQWSVAPAASYPHFITVDLGQLKTLDGFTILNGDRRAIKDVDILYSTDGINFSLASTLQIPKLGSIQNFAFQAPLSFRYFKILAKSSWDGEQFAQFAELGFYKN